MRYTGAPIGIYDYEDDIPGVTSTEIPANVVTKFARAAMAFSEAGDDAIPGFGDFWNWTVAKLPIIPEI